MMRFKLLVELPMLGKGNIYEFDDETSEVWRITKEERIGPLLHGLAGYLWLCAYDKKIMRRLL